MARDDEMNIRPDATTIDRRQRRLLFLLNSLFFFILVPSFTADSQTPAEEVLRRALSLADLYNWADAAPLFEQAESMLSAAGDERNSLRARFGRIRSNIERQDRALALVSAEIGAELADNPLLQSDKSLRMFALIVKGDIDTETDTFAMRQDWEEVAALAAELGDKKWAYRALAQLGVAAFYDMDLETARKNVGTALALATQAGDKAAQIRFLTMLATGLVESRMYEQALPFLERGLSLASTVPEAGYQFPTQYGRLKALIGIGQLDAAQLLVDDVLLHAHRSSRSNGHGIPCLDSSQQRRRSDLPFHDGTRDGACGVERSESNTSRGPGASCRGTSGAWTPRQGRARCSHGRVDHTG